MSDLPDILKAQMRNAKTFVPNKGIPILYGTHLPGIIVCFGIAYNDDSVKAPCYRVGQPSVGFNNAVWVESEES